MSAREILEKGARKLIGNGSSINIWLDPWVPNLPAFRVASNRGGEEGAPVFVRDLWENNTWNDKDVGYWFSSLEAQEIRSIPIPHFGSPDGWSWSCTKDGNYSVRSAYNLITVEKKNAKASTSHSHSKMEWKSIWKASIPPKVKSFAWKAVREEIPSRANLGKRGMLSDLMCPMCGEEIESTIHLLLKCEDIKRMWCYSPLRLDVESIDGETFRDWCVKARSCYKEDHWWDLFWCLIWGVWIRRNAWVFEGRKKRMEEVISKAVSIVGEFEIAHEISSVQRPVIQLSSSWSKPPQGVIKINSDAAIFSTGEVGFGGVMRDYVGDVVASTCMRFKGRFSADVDEALALRHSLSVALESGFRRLCLETDCLTLYSNLTKGVSSSTAFGKIVMDILELAKECQVVSLSFVKRSGNRVAHELAKLSTMFSDFRVWLEEIHDDIAHIVTEDLISLSN